MIQHHAKSSIDQVYPGVWCGLYHVPNTSSAVCCQTSCAEISNRWCALHTLSLSSTRDASRSFPLTQLPGDLSHTVASRSMRPRHAACRFTREPNNKSSEGPIKYRRWLCHGHGRIDPGKNWKDLEHSLNVLTNGFHWLDLFTCTRAPCRKLEAWSGRRRLPEAHQSTTRPDFPAPHWRMAASYSELGQSCDTRSC